MSTPLSKTIKTGRDQTGKGMNGINRDLRLFLFKDALFGAIAVEDDDFIQLFRQLPAAICVFLNQLGMNGEPFKGLGQPEAEIAAPHQEKEELCTYQRARRGYAKVSKRLPNT
jgi:hypothetical protein